MKKQEPASVWPEVRDKLGAFLAKRVDGAADVEDILQDILLRLHQQRERLRDPTRVVPWLYRTARNAIADHYRSPTRRRMVPVGGAEEVEQASPAAAPESDEPGQARAELASCLRPMLGQLSPGYREAVTLVELDGLTQKAAAEALGLSLSGMKSRVQRGREQLKRLLDACCLIQLDRRGGLRDYEVRKRPCKNCADQDSAGSPSRAG